MLLVVFSHKCTTGASLAVQVSSRSEGDVAASGSCPESWMRWPVSVVKSGACKLGLTRTERLVAVGCYTQSNYNLPLANTFVKQRAPTSWLPSTDTELGEVLENWFLETPEATIVAFEYPETRAQKLLRSRVETFLAECATVNFIKTCNFTNGYAPSSSEVASQFVETLRGREELTT